MMEELLDSRLRSTVSQLSNSLGSATNSQLLLRLLSPSRHPIQVATVITRFAIPDGEENTNNNAAKNNDGYAIFIPLQFQAILDIKIFGAVSTVKLVTSVIMEGKFDSRDELLTAVDVGFDCVGLLKTMISQARSVVKAATTKAAELSVQIAKWETMKKEKAASAGLTALRRTMALTSWKNHAKKSSALSLHSLLGNSLSHESQTSLDGSRLSALFTSFPSLSNSVQSHTFKQQKSASKGLLRERSLYSRNNFQLKNQLSLGYSSLSNANETFDFGPISSAKKPLGGSATNAANVVRFRMPNSSLLPNTGDASSTTVLSCQQQVTPIAPSLMQQQQPHNTAKGNIHAGLFSWLQDDKIFLTDEKIQEQNAADAESERIAAAAPQPLRFFTAADGLGQHGLEIVSNQIFGNRLIDQQLQEKKRQHENHFVGDAKRGKPS